MNPPAVEPGTDNAALPPLGSDLDLFVDSRMRSHRFSVPWPRLMPFGTGAVNKAVSTSTTASSRLRTRCLPENEVPVWRLADEARRLLFQKGTVTQTASTSSHRAFSDPVVTPVLPQHGSAAA